MFESLKKLFKPTSKEEERKVAMQSIDEEMNEYDREINEYLSYVEERKASPNPPEVKQPEVLSKGGGVASKTSLITPEEEKRILKAKA